MRPLNVKTPNGFKREEITIPTRFTNESRVEALIIKDIIVYRDFAGSGWTVAHKQSGHAACQHVRFNTAISIAKRLSALDWSRVRFIEKTKELKGFDTPLKAEARRILARYPQVLAG